jgi:hypothetical protein
LFEEFTLPSRSPSSSRLLSDSQHGNDDQEGLLRDPLHYASIESLLEGEYGLVTHLLKDALWCTHIGDGSNSTKIRLRQSEAQLFQLTPQGMSGDLGDNDQCLEVMALAFDYWDHHLINRAHN